MGAPRRRCFLRLGVTAHKACWEPAMIEPAPGDLRLFAANEYPFATNNDQEISYFRSTDGGMSWSGANRVSYRPGSRDGMPVPLLLNNGRDLVFAIEDNGLDGTAFKPAIVRLPAQGAWQAVSPGSPDRWGALTPEWKLAPRDHGGAPYVAQFPSGETILSFQGNAGRSGDWATLR